MTAPECAAEIGRELRADFLREYGEAPLDGRVGDWDVDAWQYTWARVQREAVYEEPEADHDACYQAFRGTLFDLES